MAQGGFSGNANALSEDDLTAASSSDMETNVKIKELKDIKADFRNPEFIAQLSLIIDLLRTEKDLHDLKFKISNGIAIFRIKNPDYCAQRIIARQSLRKFNSVDDFRPIFVPIVKQKIELETTNADTYDLDAFYEKHWEIQELDKDDVVYIMGQGSHLKKVYRDFRAVSKGEPFIICGCAISTMECKTDMDLTWKRFCAAVAYHNLLKGFGAKSAMGYGYDFSKCHILNQTLNYYIFPGVEWLPKLIKEKKYKAPEEFIGSLFGAAILIDFQTYINTDKEETKLSFKSWFASPTHTGCSTAMMRNYGKPFKLTKGQENDMHDVLLYAVVDQAGLAIKQANKEFLTGTQQEFMIRLAQLQGAST